MKLLRHHKEAFVLAVLVDIPKVDYAEKARELLTEEAISQLPEILQDKQYLPYLEMSWVNINKARCISNTKVPNARYSPSKVMIDKLIAMHELHEKQEASKREIESSLTALIETCNTLKTAKETLPKELYKYLPSEAQIANPATMLQTTSLMEKIRAAGLVLP